MWGVNDGYPRSATRRCRNRCPSIWMTYDREDKGIRYDPGLIYLEDRRDSVYVVLELLRSLQIHGSFRTAERTETTEESL